MRDNKFEIELSDRKKLQIFPISDLHVGSPQCNYNFLDKWKNVFQGTKSEKIIYLGGDLIDVAKKSLADSAYRQNMTVEEQIDYIIKFFKPVKKYIRGCTIGNHSCIDENSEFLTRDGWKRGEDLLDDDLIGSVNKNNELEYVPINKIFKYYIDDYIYDYNTNRMSFRTTTNHRFINISNKERMIDTIDNINRIEFDTLVACENNNEDLGVDDNILKLYSWCLTDSHYYNNHITFYQSGDKHKEIINILENLNINYKIRVRDRNITHIDGVKLKQKPKIQYEITIRIDEMLNLPYDMPIHKYDINEWLYKLSKKEFNIFLDEIIFCDGNSRTNNSGVIYGDEKILNIYQLLCLNYGIKTKLKFVKRADGKRDYWMLCINKRNKFRLNTKKLNKVKYKGYVYCVNNKNDTIITRKDGNILISGNSRLKKDYDLDAMKIITDILDIPYYKGGIYETLMINEQPFKIYYPHGSKVSTQPHLMLGTAIRATQHIDADLCLYGHCHQGNSIQTYTLNENGYKERTTVLTGSFLKYKGSYAEQMGLNPFPCSFPVINIGCNCNTDVKIYKDFEL